MADSLGRALLVPLQPVPGSGKTGSESSPGHVAQRVQNAQTIVYFTQNASPLNVIHSVLILLSSFFAR